jgi:hypothetical protein
VGAILDAVTIDELVATRLTTPPDPMQVLRGKPALAATFQLIMEATAKHFADSLAASALVLEHHAANPTLQNNHDRNAAALYVVRAIKFMHVVVPLTFSRQLPTKVVGAQSTGLAERLRLIADGTFGPLLRSVLQAAQPPWGDEPEPAEDGSLPPPPPPPPPPTVPGALWTDADTARQHHASWLTARRHGIRTASRLLAEDEQHAPCNEETLQALRDKHPEPGTDAAVATVSHTVAREITVQARTRCGLLSAASRSRLLPATPAALPVAPPLPPPFQEATPAQAALQHHRQPFTLTIHDVTHTIVNAPAGRAGGLDAIRYEHFHAALNTTVYAPGPDDVEGIAQRNLAFLQHLVRGYNVVLHTPEAVPEEAQRLWRAAPCTALGPKRRPIAPGSVWRRLLSATLARLLREGRLGDLLQRYHQYGFGVKSGVELVAGAVRIWHETGGTTAQVDMQNAFNSFCRGACARALECLCPALLPFFQFVYGGVNPPEMCVTLRKRDGAATDSTQLIYSQLGVQQGDPLGPVYYALTMVHLLWQVPPVPRDYLAPPSPAALAPFGGPLPSPPPPHTALADDLNLRLTPGFTAASAAAVVEIAERCARGGLKLRPDKSCVLAQLGATFVAADRHRLNSMALPYVDADLPVEEQGVRVVGVPVGTQRFAATFLRSTLFNEALWRLAWQLVGMARKNLLPAYRVFRLSLTRRFNFLARNVDPDMARVWLAAFDTFCAWVLEQLLALHGSVTVAEVRRHLIAACATGDVTTAAAGPFLRLHALGNAQLTLPPPFSALALEIARLPSAEGGLGLPQLHLTCDAAYAGRAAAVQHAALVEVLPELPQDLLQAPALPAGPPPPPDPGQQPPDVLAPPLLNSALALSHRAQ